VNHALDAFEVGRQDGLEAAPVATPGDALQPPSLASELTRLDDGDREEDEGAREKDDRKRDERRTDERVEVDEWAPPS
jgi:hypothetical protein